MSISILDIQQARQRIAPYVVHTDLTAMALPGGGELTIKMENLQATGAFKVRGAANCLLQLSEEQKKAGVLAASAGNHAQGVARSAREMGLSCTIVMPQGAPISKILATEQYGAKVVLHGAVYDDAYAHALMLSKETGATFIHPFNDEKVIAGQGTIGLEILEDMPNVGQVLVPVGGGGLAAGVALAIKSLRPDVKVYGVEPVGAASMKASLQADRVVTLASAVTIADGIAVKTPGDLTFALCNQYLDGVITVEEDDIAKAILHLLEKAKIVSEGAGAAPVAAMMAGKLPLMDDRPTVAVLSGGNIDVTMVSRIIDKGLIRAGRKAMIHSVLSDKPGQLAKFVSLLAGTGANIVSVQHDRTRPDMDLGCSAISVEIETRDRQHVFAIKAMLEEAGYPIHY